MAKFSSRSEIEARKAFIAGSEQTSIWDMDELKKLTLDELVDRFENVHQQYTLMTWKIMLRIREHFKSDKLMGQFLSELRERDPYHTLCTCSQVTLHRWIQAARFCERQRITDIHKTGMDKTALYHLSSPKNSEVAGKVYAEIKKMKLADRGEKLSVPDVERMIEQAKSITVEREPIEHEAHEIIEHAPPRLIEVKDNIAQIPEVLEQYQEPEEPHNAPVHAAIPETAQIDWTHVELVDEDELEADIRLDNNVRRRKALLAELFSLEAYYVSDEQAIEELIRLAKTYRMSAAGRIRLYQGCIAGDRIPYPVK
jgi:hypothetical protein